MDSPTPKGAGVKAMESPVSVALHPEAAKKRLSDKARLKRLKQVREAEKAAAKANRDLYRERLARAHSTVVAAEKARWEESHDTKVEESTELLARRLQRLGFAHRRAAHADQDMRLRDEEIAQLTKMRSHEAARRTEAAIETLNAEPQRVAREVSEQQRQWLKQTRYMESNVARETAQRFQKLRDAAKAAEEAEEAAKQMADYRYGNFTARPAEKDYRGALGGGMHFEDFSRSRVHATVTQCPPVAIVAESYAVSGGALKVKAANKDAGESRHHANAPSPEVLLSAVPHNIAESATKSIAKRDAAQRDEARQQAQRADERFRAASEKISIERASVEAEAAITALAEAERQRRIASARENVARHRSALASVKALREERAKKEALVQAEFERTFLWGNSITGIPQPQQSKDQEGMEGEQEHQRLSLEVPREEGTIPMPYKSASRSELIAQTIEEDDGVRELREDASGHGAKGGDDEDIKDVSRGGLQTTPLPHRSSSTVDDEIPSWAPPRGTPKESPMETESSTTPAVQAPMFRLSERKEVERIVPPRTAKMSMEVPAWRQLEPSKPNVVPMRHALSSREPRQDTEDGRFDPPRAPAWMGRGLSPPQQTTWNSGTSAPQSRFAVLQNAVLSPPSKQSISETKDHIESPNMHEAHSDYAEAVGSDSTYTNTTRSTNTYEAAPPDISSADDGDDDDLGSWSVNRSYRMTLDGDESMPDVLAAAKRSKSGRKRRKEPQLGTQSAETDTATETLNNYILYHERDRELDLQSKHSEESIEEARMREKIQARRDELEQRHESHFQHVRQAQSMMMKREQEEAEAAAADILGSAAENKKESDEGSNATVSVDTLNDEAASTIEGDTLDREPSLSGTEAAAGGGGGGESVEHRNYGDDIGAKFRRFEESSSEDSLQGTGRSSRIRSDYWPQDSYSGSDVDPSTGHMPDMSTRPQTAPSGQRKRHPAIRPHGDDDGAPMVSRVDVVLNEVDAWTDGLKRRPIGDDTRPQSAMPSDHPTSRARGGYVAGSDYTADYSMGGASPSVPPEEEIEDEIGAGNTTRTLEGSESLATGPPDSDEEDQEGNDGVVSSILAAIQPAEGMGPVAVENFSDVTVARGHSTRQQHTQISPKKSSESKRSTARSRSKRAQPKTHSSNALAASLENSPYAAPARPSQMSPRISSTSSTKGHPKNKKPWFNDLLNENTSTALSGAIVSNNSMATVTTNAKSNQAMPPKLQIDVGDSWAESGGGPATFDLVPVSVKADAIADSPGSPVEGTKSIESLTPIAAHGTSSRKENQSSPEGAPRSMDSKNIVEEGDEAVGGDDEMFEEDGAPFDPNATISRRVAGGGMNLADMGFDAEAFGFRQSNEDSIDNWAEETESHSSSTVLEDENDTTHAQYPAHSFGGGEVADTDVQVKEKSERATANLKLESEVHHVAGQRMSMVSNSLDIAVMEGPAYNNGLGQQQEPKEISEVAMSDTMSLTTVDRQSEQPTLSAASSPRRFYADDAKDSRDVVIDSRDPINSAFADARSNAQSIINDIKMPNVRTVDDVRSSLGQLSSLGSLSLDGANDAMLTAALEKPVYEGAGSFEAGLQQLRQTLDTAPKPSPPRVDATRQPLVPPNASEEGLHFDKLASIMDSLSSGSVQNFVGETRDMDEMEALEMQEGLLERMAGDMSDSIVESMLQQQNKPDSSERSSTSSSLADLMLQELDDAKAFIGAADGDGDDRDEGDVEVIMGDEDLEPGATVTVMSGKYVGKKGVILTLGPSTLRLRLTEDGAVTGNLKRTSVAVLNHTSISEDRRASEQLDSALRQAEEVASSLKERGLPYDPNIELLKKQQEALRNNIAKNREFLGGLDDEDDPDYDGTAGDDKFAIDLEHNVPMESFDTRVVEGTIDTPAYDSEVPTSRSLSAGLETTLPAVSTSLSVTTDLTPSGNSVDVSRKSGSDAHVLSRPSDGVSDNEGSRHFEVRANADEEMAPQVIEARTTRVNSSGEGSLAGMMVPQLNEDSLSMDSGSADDHDKVAAQLQRARAVLDSKEWQVVVSSNDDPSLSNENTGTNNTRAVSETTMPTKETLSAVADAPNEPTLESSSAGLEIVQNSIDRMTSSFHESGDGENLSAGRDEESGIHMDLSGGSLSIMGGEDDHLANLAMNDDSLNDSIHSDIKPPAVTRVDTSESTIHASPAQEGMLSLSLDTNAGQTVPDVSITKDTGSITVDFNESQASQFSLSLDTSLAPGATESGDVMEFDMGQKSDEAAVKRRELFQKRSRVRADRVKAASAARGASASNSSEGSDAASRSSRSPEQPTLLESSKPEKTSPPPSNVASRLAAEANSSGSKPRVSMKEAKKRSERLYQKLPEVAAERLKKKEQQERLERLKKSREDDKSRREKMQQTPKKMGGNSDSTSGKKKKQFK